MSTTNTHAPFPDVTGLRTSGPGFSRVDEHCQFLQVEYATDLDARTVAQTTSGDLSLAVLSAWTVILFHYGSHEASNVEVLLFSGSDPETIVELDFEESRSANSFPVPQLVDLVAKQQDRSVSAQDLDHGYAALIVPEEARSLQRFQDVRLQERKEVSLALTYRITNSKLELLMKASPAVHSNESARLQLRQLSAILQSYSQDPDSHALSLQRFDWKLRASDNLNYVHLPDPDYLQSHHPDRLESEFENFAQQTPHALALDFRFDLQDKVSAKWTYREMNEKAEMVKKLIWSYGVGSASSDTQSDHIVALYLEKSPETYLSFIGVLKAGAAWCPIDTDWPASRRQALLAKSNARIVLTHDDRISQQLQEDLQSDDVKGQSMKAIRLDQLDKELETVTSQPNQLSTRSIDQLAYMIWTSGTTGLPKGVGIQHQAIIQAMRALRLYIPFGKDKIGTDQIRYLQYSAYNFDLSIMDCFYTWGLGGTICSCPRSVLLQDLVQVGNSLKPTHTLLTPAVMAMTERHKVPSLKVVISGGEKLSQVVADEWSKDCCLLNLYGPAEATLIAMNRRVPFGDRVKAPNIGVALPTVSCHALDRADQVVIKGAVGELVLGGPQLARGYVGDPVKTADKFFQHPQLGRVYRTGDLVRQLENQEFEYLGRIDDQVKINGIRIELLEINAAIKNSHELIKDSETMAFPKPGNESEQQIINFSVLPEEGTSELLRLDQEAVKVARELQSNAKQTLPSYMIPNLFIILSHFPRTSSAKIDRVALKNVLTDFDQLEWENKLANDEEDSEDQAAAPTKAEHYMRKWLAKLCNVDPEKIGRKTPFASVGLDSIRAMSFSQRLTKDGYPVSVLDVARFPSLLSLSQKLSESGMQHYDKTKAAETLFSEIEKFYADAIAASLRTNSDRIDKILPCTPLQEGMLAESQRDPFSYRIQRQYRIPSDVDEGALQQSLQKVVHHFDSLRTSFVDIGALDLPSSRNADWPFEAHFLQVVWKETDLHFEHLDLGPDQGVEASVIDLVSTKLSLDPFSSKPPVAFLMITQGEDKFLILVAHHSTYDARSLGILEDWIEAMYEGRDPPQIHQFSTALAHILPLTKEEAKNKSEIWTQALENYPKGVSSPFPLLSTKRPESNLDRKNLHRSAYIRASTSWTQVESICRELGVSARPLVQVAWAEVLGAYLDTRHLILGDSVSGRTLSAELDHVYGPVLSTVPVPIAFEAGQSARALIKKTDAFHSSVMEAQHTDLGAIRKMLQLEAGEPLFHCVFVLEPANDSNLDSSTSFRLQKVADLAVATEHTLGVEVLPDSDGNIKLGLSWHEALISEEFGRLMLAQFDQSLAKICDSGLSEDDDRKNEEFYSLSRRTDASHVDAVAHENIANLIFKDDGAAAQVNAVEIYQDLTVSSGKRLPAATISYDDLDRTSSQVAALLHSLPRNSVVAVCLERSLESYIVPVAIFKAGHAYLPIDETLPLDRKQDLLLDSQAALLIGSSKTISNITVDSDVRKLLVDSADFRQTIASSAAKRSVAQVEPDDVSFIIYTSGSTGKPKGCLLTYQNLSSAIAAFHDTYEREAPGSFKQPARFLARSAEAFDVHLLEIFLSLKTGATIVSGPRAMVHEDIGLTISALEITHACVVPSLFFSKGERIKPSSVPSLRALIIGGEALTEDLCQLWGSSEGEQPVVMNAYGPSEATIGTSIARVRRDSRPSNIGKPFPGTRYMVMKETNGKLVPTLRGEPGELCISGVQVAKGYLNRPELKSFIRWQGEWLYRTGDLVRLYPNDETEYLGRLDGSQVKVRGARLELGEVDSALVSCLAKVTGRSGSAVTIVSSHGQAHANPRLIAFFARESQRTQQAMVNETILVRSEESRKLASQLRKEVRNRLPQHMVPSLVLPLSFIPVSELSGKADRKTLKALYESLDPQDFTSLSEEASRPFTEEERLVSELLSSTVRLDSTLPLTPTLDLLAAGLDSLSVVTLAGKLRKVGYNVSAASIMNDPTIEAIVATKKQGASRTQTPRDYARFDKDVASLIEKVRSMQEYGSIIVQAVIPCVPMQAALISQAASQDSQDKAAPRYITTITVDVHADYSAEEIRHAWSEALASHDIYRTVFSEIDGRLVQVILAPESFKPNWSATSQALPRGDDLTQYHRTVSQKIASSLNLEPPLRLRLWEGGDKRVLTLTCSHAVYDGESLKNLLGEAGLHLKGQAKDLAHPTQFSQVVRELSTESEEDAKAFWTKKLEGFSQTSVPNLTGVRPDINPDRTEELTVASGLKFSHLESCARSRKVTVHAILLSAFCHLMGLYTGEEDVTIGLVLSGRTVPVEGIDSVHGPCVTTVPFRLQDARKDHHEAQSLATHKAINEILPRQHISLPSLMKWLNLDRSPIEALFSYLGAHGDLEPEERVFTDGSTIMERDFPLALEVGVTEQKLQLHLAFNSRYIPPEQARLFLSQYDSILQAAVLAKSSKVEDTRLSILNQDCYKPKHPSESFLSRFRKHCSDDPEAPAIVFASSMEQSPEVMTYGQLGAVSDNIAKHLVTHREQIIGVHLNKDGPELYAAIIAIWKAGKTYLPLDPALPRERLEFMIETVGQCPTLVTEQTSKNLEGSKCQLLDLESLLQPPSTETMLPEPRLDVPCYLLFTSGSTGKPKAVQISQRALAAALCSWERILPFSKSSRFLQLASIGFDVSLIELCMPLSLGFSIGTAPKQVLLEDLTTSIKHLGITIADLPAALAGTVHPQDVQLEWLMSGGDVIDSRVIQDWNDASRILINAWGPTEATIGNTLGQIKSGSTRNVIGKVYPTSSMYVLEDSSNRILPLGAIGELAVGGPQVADKYFGRENLTAEKFILLEDGRRVYRTGDLGRFLHDGTVECLGRIGSDRQVKVNGQRMELDEVSSVLSSQKGVHDADVQYLKHPSMGSKQLVTFVAQTDKAANTGELSARDDEDAVELSVRLEQEAIKRLPAYMIPTHWIITNRALPLSHNNKIDHKALATFYDQMDVAYLRSFGAKREGAAINTTWSEEEQKLRNLIATFCDISPQDITKTTSFHRLGIDSITAIRLVRVLREAGYQLTVAQVLSTPYISALAEKGRATGKSNTQQGLDAVHRWTEKLRPSVDLGGLRDQGTIESILPCTPLQAGMIAQTLASSGKLYFHHHAYRIPRRSVEEIRSAWRDLVTRLDILRTTFHQADGEHPWVQVVHSSAADTKILLHEGQFSSAGFDQLEGQPSFDDENAFSDLPHVLHIWQEESSCVTLISIHHALYDGSSLPQLLEDFEALLSRHHSELPKRLPFSQLVPSLLSEEADVEHWVEQLQGHQVQLLGSKDDGRGHAVLVEKDLALTPDEFEAKCRPLGVSLQVLCNLAFAKLLALETDTRDVCFGQLFGLLDVAAEADTAVGPAFNTVATRVRFDDLDRPVKEVLRSLQQANDAGRPHRRAALRDVQARLQQGTLFDALFDFQLAYDQEEGLLQSIHLAEDGQERPQYVLNVAFVRGPQKLSVVSKADSSKYDQPALTGLVERLEKILCHMVEDLSRHVSALPPSLDQSFPRTLPTAPASVNGDAKKHVAPLTEDGRTLASIIANVSGVGVETIGGDTRLASLGLDSISAIRIATQARRAGLKLGMGQIVSGDTINGILAQIAPTNGTHVNGNGNVAENKVSKSPMATVTLTSEVNQQIQKDLHIREDQIEQVLPLLAGQKFWLANWIQTNGGGGYSFAYHLSGATATKVRATWQKLRKHQPILRTAFFFFLGGAGSSADQDKNKDKGPLQIVLSRDTVIDDPRFEVIAPDRNEDEKGVVNQVVARQAAKGWTNLSRPPLQLTLVGETLVFSLHHLLYDAFSIEFLVRDFASLYGGGPLISSDRWIDAVAHITAVSDETREEANMYWKDALRGATSGILPCVTATPSKSKGTSASGGGEKVEIFQYVTDAVQFEGTKFESKLRKVGLTLPSIVLGSWSEVLAARIGGGSCEGSKSAAPLFGVYHLGRSIDSMEMDRIQGPLLTVLPMALSGCDGMERAKQAAQALRTRPRFEQTDLVEAHLAAGLSISQSTYNTFVNLLLESPSDDDDADHADLGKEENFDHKPNLVSVDLGNPTDFDSANSTKITWPPLERIIDLPHAKVIQPDVNVDIQLAKDAISIGIKAKTTIVADQHALSELIREFAKRIQQTLDSI